LDRGGLHPRRCGPRIAFVIVEQEGGCVRRRTLRGGVVWAVVVALVLGSLLVAGPAALAATKRINGVGNVWQPTFRRIGVGDRIVWRAVSNPHTVTAYRKRSGKRGRRWRKDTRIDPGQSTSKRFRKAGLYRFKCKLHPGMVGRVRVVA
jgi:plastocyanin